MSETPKKSRKTRKVGNPNEVDASFTLRRSARKMAKKSQPSPEVIFAYEDAVELLPRTPTLMTPNAEGGELPIVPSPTRPSTKVGMHKPEELNVKIEQPVTPRRSARVSVMPHLDYEELIEKHATTGERVENGPKWTPSKVGRISEKRTRKKRTNYAYKHQKQLQTSDEHKEIKAEANSDTEPDSDEQLKKVNDLKEEKEVMGSSENVEQFVIPSIQIEEVEDMPQQVHAPLALRDSIGKELTCKQPGQEQVNPTEPMEEKCVSNELTTVLSEQMQHREDSHEQLNEETILSGSIEQLQVSTEVNKDVSISSKKIEHIPDGAQVLISSCKTTIVTEPSKTQSSKQTTALNDEHLQTKSEDPMMEHSNPHEYLSKAAEQLKTVVEVNSPTFESVKINEVEASELGLKMLSDENEGEVSPKSSHNATNAETKSNEDTTSIICLDDDTLNVIELNSTFSVDENDSFLGMPNSAAEETSCKGKKSAKKSVRLQETAEVIDMQTRNDDKASKQLQKHKIKPTTYQRMLTPYKAKKALDVKYAITDEAVTAHDKVINDAQQSELAIDECHTPVQDQTKERKMRKRSYSLNMESDTVERSKTLRFDSAENRTIYIDTIDEIISERVNNVGKMMKALDSTSKGLKRHNSRAKDQYVTQRRRRSRSLPCEEFVLPKPMAIAKAKKMPNFAAMHQKQFEEMENVVEHIERKAERAKAMLNSNSKLRLPASQKKDKNAASVANSKSPGAKIGARKRIELKQGQDKPLSNNDTMHSKLVSKLPVPRQPLLPTTQKCANAITKELPQLRNQLTPGRLMRNAAVDLQPQNAQAEMNKTVFTFGATKTTPHKANATANVSYAFGSTLKAEEHKKRHRELYKGRTNASSKKREELIRGVRSNRRFELQMQHRRNLHNS